MTNIAPLIRNRDEAKVLQEKASAAYQKANRRYWSVTHGKFFTLEKHREVEAVLLSARKAEEEAIKNLLRAEYTLEKALGSLTQRA